MHEIRTDILARIWVIACVLGALPGATKRADAQDRITLRPVATPVGNIVRVADVAEVVGPTGLGEVVLIQDLAAELRAKVDGIVIDVPRVRAALAKDRTINWGRLTLSGVACRVKAASGDVHFDMPRSRASADGLPTDGPSMREHVHAWLARLYDVDVESVRATFDESQAELLDSPTGGLTLSIRSLGNSDKLSLAVTAYRGDSIAHSETLRVAPLIQRKVAVSTRRLNRGEAITPDAIKEETQWLLPSVVPVTPESLQGVIARSRIDAGAVIRAEHIDQPIVIKKGEIVTVDCVSGGVVVRAMARAMVAARDGEVIAFQYLESKRSFNARVNGPGRAVMVVDTSTVDEVRAEQDAGGDRSTKPIRQQHARTTNAHSRGEAR